MLRGKNRAPFVPGRCCSKPLWDSRIKLFSKREIFIFNIIGDIAAAGAGIRAVVAGSHVAVVADDSMSDSWPDVGALLEAGTQPMRHTSRP